MDLEARMKLYKDECKEVGKELMISGMKLKHPQGKGFHENPLRNLINFFDALLDRVKMCQWLKKLSELRNNKLSDLTMKHEYLQYLRVTLQGDLQVLTKPFNEHPPDELMPFAECIANKTADLIPGIPRAGNS